MTVKPLFQAGDLVRIRPRKARSFELLCGKFFGIGADKFYTVLEDVFPQRVDCTCGDGAAYGHWPGCPLEGTRYVRFTHRRDAVVTIVTTKGPCTIGSGWLGKAA